ncbi:MAG TPA: hypothetical protein VEI07_26465 [Planctomycetaceae bacterium]|nr:hypothetical protein [Planctomycetaceae bacterium]
MRLRHLLGGCLTVVLLLVGGCLCMVFAPGPVKHDPPRVIGTRKDASGKVLEQFVYDGYSQNFGWFPGPHGPAPFSHRSWNKAFIREPGKPDRELPFLRDLRLNYYVCRPVANAPYWVMQTDEQDNPWITRILAFDDSHLLRNRVLPYEHDFTKDDRDFFYRDGNRRIIYRTAHGFEQYDIVTDELKACEKPPHMPEDDWNPLRTDQ